MSNLKQHFQIGQKVFYIDYIPKSKKCSQCNGKGKKIIKGKEWHCVECEGEGSLYTGNHRRVIKEGIIRSATGYRMHKPKDAWIEYGMQSDTGTYKHYDTVIRKRSNPAEDLYMALFPTKALARKALQARGKFIVFKQDSCVE